MLIDLYNQFSDSQAVTSTAISTNVINATHLSNTLKDLGQGEDLYLQIVCTESATAAGAATVTFSFESDSTADLATSATTHWSSAAIGKASLTAGTVVATVCLPPGVTYEAYLGVRYTVATGPLTAGKFTAFLTKEAPSWAAYTTSHVTKNGR